MNLFPFAKGGQDQNFCPGMNRIYLPGYLNPIRPGHLEIQQDKVNRSLRQEKKGCFTAAGFACDLYIRDGLQEQTHALPEQGMVINN